MADKKNGSNIYRQILIYGGVALVAAFIGAKVGSYGGRHHGYGKGGYGHHGYGKGGYGKGDYGKGGYGHSGHKGAGVLFRLMKSAGPDGLAIEEIEEEISAFLSEADADGDGNLTRHEIKREMKRLSRE